MSEAKKRRVEGVRGVQEPQAAMQLLTSVCVVCRDDPRIDALSHVTDLIDAYVDYSIHWTLPNAVKKATSAHLVKRLLGRMDSLNEEDRRLQLEHAIEHAAAMGSLPFTQQLHENLSTFPIRLDYEVAVAAALSGGLAAAQMAQGQRAVAVRPPGVLGGAGGLRRCIGARVSRDGAVASGDVP